MEEELNRLKKENKELKEKVQELEARLQTNRGELQKQGMIRKAAQGNIVARPPFGYKLESGKLIPTENFREVEDIFENFLNENISLTKLAKKHNFSVNGLKKILTNFTYIGKVRFNNQIHNGNHKPLISTTLFNHTQNKLERLRK